MQQSLHHKQALQITEIAESLHRRISALEARTGGQLGQHLQHLSARGGGVFQPVLDNSEFVLTTIQKIQNYEQTIQDWGAQFEVIQRKCANPNKTAEDYYEIVSLILDALAGEDIAKADRDEEMLHIINKNLQTLQTMQCLAKNETQTRIIPPPYIRLSSQTDFISDQFILDTVTDVGKTVKSIVQYKKTIQGISLKFNLIKQKIATLDWNNAATILTTAIDIISIINEEEIVKKDREDRLLHAMKQISLTFQDVITKVAAMHTMRSEYSLQAEVGPALGNPFGIALNTLQHVLEGIETVIYYQRTIDQICIKYEQIKGVMTQLYQSRNFSDVITHLITFIQVLKDENDAKLKRDGDLIYNLDYQNNTMRDLTSQLSSMGYTIV